MHPPLRRTRGQNTSHSSTRKPRAVRAPLIEHLAGIGFRRFKLINQVNFLELSEQRRPFDRAVLGVMRRLGYDAPRLVRRGGRFFTAGHSSGPGPWSSSGRWLEADTLLASWKISALTRRFDLCQRLVRRPRGIDRDSLSLIPVGEDCGVAWPFVHYR